MHMCVMSFHPCVCVPKAAKVEGSEGFEELQEAREVELEAFHPAPRETEADRTNDIRFGLWDCIIMRVLIILWRS